ncbi:hypothetical protein FHR32_006290 [Streptosporangium album]|uniref:Uncharacterized protein n=1 Tax=Streptosporangium album TaxID=47479 RepID=A0A7W7S0Z8_9ACTN|nr:hypothetical protein [Streptosporangium album]
MSVRVRQGRGVSVLARIMWRPRPPWLWSGLALDW